MPRCAPVSAESFALQARRLFLLWQGTLLTHRRKPHDRSDEVCTLSGCDAFATLAVQGQCVDLLQSTAPLPQGLSQRLCLALVMSLMSLSTEEALVGK